MPVSPADLSFHVHLRQGAMCELVTPHVRQGGIHTAYVMVGIYYPLIASIHVRLHPQPNLVPPLTSADAAIAYKKELERIAPDVEFLMTLYLHPEVTPEEIVKAAKAGIRGEKSLKHNPSATC